LLRFVFTLDGDGQFVTVAEQREIPTIYTGSCRRRRRVLLKTLYAKIKKKKKVDSPLKKMISFPHCSGF
jgi:hypothetical protein